MGKSAIMSVRLIGDETGAVQSFKATEQAASRFQGTMDRVASTAVFTKISSGLFQLGKDSYDAASAAEQNMGAVSTVFGSAADSIISKSQEAANAVGMSSSSYQELAASIGGSMRSAITDQGQLSAKTQELISAGADLSSVFGGSAAEAVGAMGAALRGEFDPLERFGVFLNMNAVKAVMAARGMSGLSGAAEDAAKKQVIQSMIMEQAGQYMGNFGREADTAAGAQQRAAAAIEDMKASLGKALLPVLSAASKGLAAFAGFAAENASWLTPLAIGFGLIAAAVIGYNAVMAAVPALTAAWTAAQWLLNAALNANPIGVMLLLIAALVAALVWAWNNVDTFRAGVIQAWEWIVSAGQKMGEWFASLPGSILKWLGDTGKLLWNAGKQIIGGFLNGLKDMWRNVTSFIGGIGPWIAAHKGPLSYDKTLLVPAGLAIMGGFNDSLERGMARTRQLVAKTNNLVAGIGDVSPTATVGVAGGGASGGGAGSGINITIQGAVDPYSTAKQIKDLLDGYSRAQGGTVTGLGGGNF